MEDAVNMPEVADEYAGRLGRLRFAWDYFVCNYWGVYGHRLLRGWYVKNAARWLRGRLWYRPVLRLLDRPELCRRLPHWLLRTVVRAQMLIAQRCHDQVAERQGTLTRPYARQRVRGWTDSRVKVLAELDQWVSIMAEVREHRADLQS